MRTNLTQEIVNYIRDLYSTTNYTLVYISECVQKRFNIKVDYRVIHRVCKNKQWIDSTYTVPSKTYRKITPEIKKYILDSSISIKDLASETNLSETRIRQLKKKLKGDICLII